MRTSSSIATNPPQPVIDTAHDPAHLRERLIALTRDLVLIPSSEERPDELRRATEWVGNHLESLEGVVVHSYETNGVTSLVALPAGCAEPDVLMFGHVDVVHHVDPHSYRSELAEGRIYGPGTGDMKGIVAILLELFRKFQLQSPGISLGLAITSDEERGGENGTRALLEEHGLRCKVALVPDGGSPDEVVVEEKGILQLDLEVTGRACHAARPWLGDNALEYLISVSREIASWVRANDPPPVPDENHWHSTCCLTRLWTPNLSGNRIPSHAGATLDIRFPGPFQSAEILKNIESLVPPPGKVTRVLSAEPSILSPDPAFFDACESVLGYRPRERREHGGSDARFIANHDIPVIMSRPLCGNLHSRREWIDIDSMVQFHEIYRKYLEVRLGS